MKDLEEILKMKSTLALHKKTVLNIAYTYSVQKDEISSMLKEHDLSIEQFNVLRILRGQKGNPANLQDVQSRMVNKMSNTTRLIDKLLKKDLVKRSVCLENRRKVEIFITEDGLNLLKVVDPKIEDAEENLVSNLTQEELTELNMLLTKLRN
ncbi:transcriptional regulator, MarR family [Flavobacteriaceae bacterium MAR_2010_188]|nr:transcriptional regulator, MarR family [Flavobacteriaceae bacterium MAR_2010_188]